MNGRVPEQNGSFKGHERANASNRGSLIRSEGLLEENKISETELDLKLLGATPVTLTKHVLNVNQDGKDT